MESIKEEKVQQPTKLALDVIERLSVMKMNKAVMAMRIGCSRPLVSQYLAGKYQSNPETIETALRKFMAETEEEYGGVHTKQSERDRACAAGKGEVEGLTALPQKKEYYKTADYLGVMSVCQSCQEGMGLGIIVGKSGYGKTYALKKFAQLARVAYIECDDTMCCRDLVDAIEQQLGMTKASTGTIWKRVNRIREFLNVNTGYLLIVDEADKLINKYTTAKMEILRGIYDQADVGIVIAGEPKLESDIKSVLARFANRVDFYYKLRGMSRAELSGYLEGWEVSEEAEAELASRAFDARNGCFRLLDRTLNNVLRVLANKGETAVTAETMAEASGMMML